MVSSDIDCNIDGAKALLLLGISVAVHRDAGANDDTKDVMARKQSIGLMVRL